MPYVIEISNQQSSLPVSEELLVRALRAVLAGEGIGSAEVSLAVVDDPTIHELNRRYLQHDYATDVLSFVLEQREGHLDGEIIVSADTAQRNAAEFGGAAESELVLYAIHGALHLTGYDDHTPEDRAVMRQLERRYLAELGIDYFPAGADAE